MAPASRRYIDLVRGKLLFTIPPTSPLRQPYQTLHGPAVSCNGVVYQPDIPSLELALYRQFCARDPDNPGVDEQLYVNQAANAPRYVHVARRYALATTRHGEYMTSYWEERAHHADPHPKRALRVRAHHEARCGGTDHVYHRLERGRNVVKFKVEVGKIGKAPRTIVDIGVAGSLVGFRLAELWKKRVAATPLEYRDIRAHFIPAATHRDLKRGFDLLRTAETRLTMLVFSDDAALAVRRPDGTVSYIDVDIKSCDKSHGAALFHLLQEFAPHDLRHDLTHLVDQLRAPLLIRNPHRREEKVYVRPTEPTLYSGSVLTTMVNNIAVFLIAMACADHSVVDAAGVANAAQSVGYLVTAEEKTCFEQVQFLKHSPALDVTGEWHPVLNMGVMLRASGMVYGEMPGTRTDGWRLRAERQQAALLMCTWPNTTFPLVAAMRRRYPGTTAAHLAHARRERHWSPDTDGWPALEFTDASVLKRYGWTAAPPDVAYFFHHADVFTIHSGPGLARILETDYAMSNLALNALQRNAVWRRHT